MYLVPGGVLSPGGVPSPGGCLVWGGGSVRGDLVWGGVTPPHFFDFSFDFFGDPPPGKQTQAYGQRAAGTHPTGMHSCTPCLQHGFPGRSNISLH